MFFGLKTKSVLFSGRKAFIVFWLNILTNFNLPLTNALFYRFPETLLLWCVRIQKPCGGYMAFLTSSEDLCIVHTAKEALERLFVAPCGFGTTVVAAMQLLKSN
jgi:hypothetical protein